MGHLQVEIVMNVFHHSLEMIVLNVNYCALGFTDPSTNCTQCAPNWNEDCSDCLPNWDRPNCGYCSPHFTGDKCDICATNWEGDNCDTCPIRFKESPGNCEECSALFTGDNCLECADGFTGENCTEYIDDSSFDTVYAVDPFIYEIVVGVVAATIIGCCIVAILIMLVVRSRKRKNNQKKFIPVLDLDEEDAIELDTNPLVKTEDTNALFDINEWGDDSANMNVGGLDIDIDDEYEGALDLDDFDAQF